MKSQSILLAFDKFKGTMSAQQVCKTVALTINKLHPDWQITQLPITDGGGGSLDILFSYGFTPIEVKTVTALLEPKKATYAISQDGERAFIEMASICGITELNRLDPFGASSIGLGIAALNAINRGAKEITISLGGSASTDGGLGFLIGLGAVALDANGIPVSPNLAGFRSIYSLNIEALKSNITWTFLADVTNPLVGDMGTAQVFGKQKGLEDKDVLVADQLLNKWANLLSLISSQDVRHIPGTGAAGGIAAAGIALLDGVVISGSNWFAELLGLRNLVLNCDTVITGEGHFDEQSFMGKAPGHVIDLAESFGKKVHVLAGNVDSQIMRARNIKYVSLTEIASSSELAISDPEKWLESATIELTKILNF